MGDSKFKTILWALIGGYRAQVISLVDEIRILNALVELQPKMRKFEISREKNLEVDPCMEDPGYSFQASPQKFKVQKS